ncbi:hypothetical protein [Paraglaciecola arctica]|uniref:Integrase catalytic domain-containing protein n=1 Tax=Paraglaciecola arctica BSs20135 TaxID=493475 RepID=K6YQ72_9ALTE|nr:hypothetical protein [Paraglaciecola arctica]GAC20292.1 hypothetical protein GARC_3334 [Paraglaciecola arctica BSs20135]
MELAINKVLVAPPLHSHDNNPARFTVVEYQYGSDIVVLCQQDRKRPKKPFVHRIGSPIKLSHCSATECVDWQLFSLESQSFSDAVHIRYYRDLWLSQNIPRGKPKTIERFFERRENRKKEVEARRRVVERFEQIAQRKYAFFNGEISTQCMKSFAKSLGVTYDFVWDTLSKYYAFGQCEEALISASGNSGRNTTLPENSQDAERRFPTGRGRKRKSNNQVKRVSNKQDSKDVEAFIKSNFHSIQYFSLKHLCKYYNSEYATKLIYEDEFGRKIYDYIPEKFLTISQFKTLLFRACGGRAKFEKIKHGAKEFRNKFKIHTSTVMKHVIGPGHMYEIDATVLDVHLISKYCTEEWLPIERPILYSVVDVSTNIIAGFHLSLNGANAEAVTLALFNAMSDKGQFCKQWGYDYQPGDWPCHHVCHTLVIDRGAEYLDAAMSALIKSQIGLASIQVTEAYLGRAKGSVEGLFNKLNKSCIHGLPGALIKGRAKAKKDPSNHAVYTIDDLYYILIEEIIAHNNQTILKKKVTQEHLENGVRGIPRELWNWGLEELMDGGKTVDPKTLMSALLPKKKAIVSKTGVKLTKDGFNYQTSNKQFEEMRQEIAVDRKCSDFEIDVMALPSWTQNVWLQMGTTSNDIIAFDLADSSELLKNLHFAEALAILEDQAVFASGARYANSVDDSIRVKTQRDIAISNRENLRGLLRSEGKSPAKGRQANTKADRFYEAQNNANTVCAAMNDDYNPQAIHN